MKGLRVTKIVKEMKFKGVWGELEAKKCFQRQSEKLLLVFMSLLTALSDKNCHI